MNTDIGTFSFNWDKNGIIATSFYSDLSISMDEEMNYIGLSVPLLISGQLGVLSIRSDLDLIGPYLKASDSGKYKIYRIGRSLIGAEISLHRKDGKVVHQFNPQIGQNFSEEQIESAVVQFILNLVAYSNSILPEEILLKSKFFSMTSFVFFFDMLREGVSQNTILTLDGGDPWLMPRMNRFCIDIYNHWGDIRVPRNRVRDIPQEILPAYRALRKKLRIRQVS